MKLVSVVIANWNRGEYLRSCLRSLVKQTYKDTEIIVVDNSSADGSQQIVRDDFPQAKLLVNRRNLLYCRAQNQGIAAAQGEFVLSLNNDVILERAFVEELVKAVVMDEGIGMVCGKIMSWDGSNIDSAGQLLSRARKPVERGYKRKDSGQFNEPGYIFSAGGVAPLYRRKMLEQIKIDGEYFDEDYGMFYEDLDIAWRARHLGWRGFYNPRALAYHRRGGSCKASIPKISFFKRYDFAYLSAELKVALVKNRYMTILKNDSPKDFLVNLVKIIGYEVKIWAYIIFFHPNLIPGLIKNIGCLKAALRRRRKIQHLGRKSLW